MCFNNVDFAMPYKNHT